MLQKMRVLMCQMSILLISTFYTPLCHFLILILLLVKAALH